MAINPHNRYPGQTAAPTPEYPYGNARNQTVPGDRRGTPLERTWVSDLWGFFQAILTEAGITPSGTPDAANNSQYLSGLKKILSLQNLFDRTAADQGTPGSAQLEGKLLQIVDSVRSDIIAGDVERAYARLRGEANLSHVVASAVEDEVYAALTSWLDTERARLSLRGTLREILGRDMAGDGAPISVPNGLNVGTSFMPPAGYLPGNVVRFSDPGNYSWPWPDNCRGAQIEIVGGGGRGARAIDTSFGEGSVHMITAAGGGGGETRRLWIPMSGEAPVNVVVGSGATLSSSASQSTVSYGSNSWSAQPGGNASVSSNVASPGAGGSGGSGPGESLPGLVGGQNALTIPASEAGTYSAGTAQGGATASYPYGWGGAGSIPASGSPTVGKDGVIVITPYF